MLKNYLKLAFRNIFRYKRYALINIVGLAVGLGACLLITGYVIHELSYESMHPEKERIFRINGRIPMAGQELLNGVVGGPLGPAAKESIPEIEESVRILRRHNVPIQIGNQIFKENLVFIAESEILKVFSIPLLIGNSNTALSQPYTVVIDENIARKYFGNENPMGKTIRLMFYETYDFQVTGIIKNIPSNTVLRTQMIVSFATLYQTHREAITEWQSWGMMTTFIRLQKGVDPETVGDKITTLARQHLDEDERDASYYLQPLENIYIGASSQNINNDLNNSGSITRLYIFSCIALLILIIAAINFINISTAKISNRLKEVGVRKTCGAPRSQLIKQFLMESIMITTIAMVLGLGLFSLFKPQLDNYLGETINLGLLSTPWILPVVLMVVVIVGFIAGSYPAFFLSRFPAAVVFRTGITRGPSKYGLRRTLVGIQFFFAGILVVSTLIVLKQVKYSETKDLGYDKDNLIVLNIRNSSQLKDIDIIKTQILGRSQALSAASVGSFPSVQNRNISTIHLEDKTDEKGTIVQSIDVDEDFIPTLGLTVTSGRNFERGRAADSESVLLNETAVQRLELKNPIGKYLYRGKKAFRIIGVVKDWNTNSIHSRIYSTVLFHSNGSAGDLIIRLPESNEQAVLSGIRNIFTQLLPGQIFDYAYIEDLNLRAYEKEKRLASLLISFCELTILVACLGIFGLAACSTEQRTKEIGIRKVLGSSVSGIVILFTGSYTRWVIVANLFAWPAAYYFVRQWLQSFAFRTTIGPWPFLTAVLITLFVALLSVVFQTIKAALANPVKSLRYE